MSQRTIGPDGNDERQERQLKPVKYLFVLQGLMNEDEAAAFEDGNEVFLCHPTRSGLIRTSVYAVRVMK